MAQRHSECVDVGRTRGETHKENLQEKCGKVFVHVRNTTFFTSRTYTINGKPVQNCWRIFTLAVRRTIRREAVYWLGGGEKSVLLRRSARVFAWLCVNARVTECERSNEGA